MKAKMIFISISLAFLSHYLMAQTGNLSGVVQDTTGNALTGVNIGLIGTSYGAASNYQGQFFIEGVPAGSYELQASSIGMGTIKKNVQIKAGETTKINITLRENVRELQQVEVIGRPETSYKNTTTFSATRLESRSIDVP